MAEKSTIARPYAQAAFSMAESQGNLKKWSEMLQLIAALASDDAMQVLIDNPSIDNDKLVELIIGICGEGLDQHGQNFVRMLTDNKRLDVISEIADLYEAKRAEAERTVEAEVTSASPLSAAQQAQLVTALKKRLGRDVTLVTKTDETILGGAIVRAGDLVIDASVTGQLEQLANTLMH
ncbi:MAG: F0F1 ATP synthase subunit delta [Halobacteria archaeon]|nr:F0F1 ATP synthase subunit delta [Halobacteria archaeon]